MNDLLADTSGIQSTAANIEETSSNVMTLANQVLSTAEATVWNGRASAAFVDAVETFREQKDRLGQILTQMGGDVDSSAMDHSQNEDDQAAGMKSKAGMMA